MTGPDSYRQHICFLCLLDDPTYHESRLGVLFHLDCIKMVYSALPSARAQIVDVASTLHWIESIQQAVSPVVGSQL